MSSSDQNALWLYIFTSLKFRFVLTGILLLLIDQSKGLIASQYVGCFAEIRPEIGSRQLNTSIFPNPGYIDVCITACADLHYTYAGLQFGGECWCGDYYNNVPSNGCTYLCSKCIDCNLFCGGPYTNSLYLTCPPSQFGWNSTGCTGQCGRCICQVTTGVCLTKCDHGWTGPNCMQDMNECYNKSLNNCSQTCNNSPGSYNCSCYEGFTLHNDSITCNDIDECLNLTLTGCAVGCNNTPGSFICTCLTGYTLNVDNKTCHDAGTISSVISFTAFIACVVVLSVCLVASTTAFTYVYILYKRKEKQHAASLSHMQANTGTNGSNGASTPATS